jgi:uncharacterized membrane protein YhaH (DUF805 family)
LPFLRGNNPFVITYLDPHVAGMTGCHLFLPWMDFYIKHWIEAITQNYANFRGRATRTQFWMFTLVHMLILIALQMTMIALTPEPGSLSGGAGAGIIGLFALIYLLGTFVPSLAISARRLHDTGRSAWWYLLSFIPLIGLVVIVFFCLDSDTDNKWGLNPKADLEHVGEE